jgi:hypothetical protein
VTNHRPPCSCRYLHTCRRFTSHIVGTAEAHAFFMCICVRKYRAVSIATFSHSSPPCSQVSLLPSVPYCLLSNITSTCPCETWMIPKRLPVDLVPATPNFDFIYGSRSLARIRHIPHLLSDPSPKRVSCGDQDRFTYQLSRLVHVRLVREPVLSLSDFRTDTQDMTSRLREMCIRCLSATSPFILQPTTCSRELFGPISESTAACATGKYRWQWRCRGALVVQR